MLNNKWHLNHVMCIECHNSSFSLDCNSLKCIHCGKSYPIVSDIPIFLRTDNDVFPSKAFLDCERTSVALRQRMLIGRLGSFIPRISVNLSSVRCLKLFANLLPVESTSHVLVIGSGRQRKWLDKRFAEYSNIELVYSDIDRNALVDYFCDAHDLPFVDGCFDGIITTAVLQHVMYPEKAVAEIFRVLKPSGLIYSEMAFMQQVIEGAYDFTRYTLTGHRRIFNHFEEIEAGLVAGPATALVWSIENFALAFFRRPPVRLVVKSLVRLMFFWIKYIDYLLKNSPQALDGASCTFFLGRKQQEIELDSKIISRYSGGKHLEHV